MGLPRPRFVRHLFRTGPVTAGDVRSPCLVDYPYGLVLDRGMLKVWVLPGLSPAARVVLADHLEKEARLLREEAEQASPRRWVTDRSGGDPDADHSTPEVERVAAGAAADDRY